jgi:hypothetical protein
MEQKENQKFIGSFYSFSRLTQTLIITNILKQRFPTQGTPNNLNL